MFLLKDKHMITAMLIAPILAIISYFSVDAMVSEAPHKAQRNNHYPLVEHSNCRYSSGRCSLKNGNFELVLHIEALVETGMVVVLTSTHPLTGVKVSMITTSTMPLGETGSDRAVIAKTKPSDMLRDDRTAMKWRINLPKARQGDRLRLAAVASGTYYFGEVATAFINYETSYQKDFRTTN